MIARKCSYEKDLESYDLPDLPRMSPTVADALTIFWEPGFAIKFIFLLLQVYVIEGKVAEVFIECVTCKVYKSLKYVRSRVLKITGRCNNCFVSGQTLLMEYKWQIIASNGTVFDYPLRNSTESMDVLVIKENKFDGVSTYVIRLTVRVIGTSFCLFFLCTMEINRQFRDSHRKATLWNLCC